MKFFKYFFIFFLLFSTFNFTYAQESQFIDLKTTDPHFIAIEYLSLKNVIQGYPDGRFLAEAKTNRAELIKLMVTGLGIEPDSQKYQNCFSDVKAEWFAKYICYAKEQGWVQGYPEGDFRPANLANEAEALKMILNPFFHSEILSFEESSLMENAGWEPIEWYAIYMEFAESKNILENASDFIASGSPTRGEIAEYVYRSKLIKEQNWPEYHSYLANHWLRQENLDYLADLLDYPEYDQCYPMAGLEFDFLNAYLKTEYQLTKPYKKIQNFEKRNLTQTPLFDKGYFCPMKNGEIKFLNVIFKDSSTMERHLMDFDKNGELIKDEFKSCDPQTPLLKSLTLDFAEDVNVKKIDPETLELFSCNYLKDHSDIYYIYQDEIEALLVNDPDKFNLIENAPISPGLWGKTDEKLYLASLPLREVEDPKSFEFINAIYSKDSRHVFHLNTSLLAEEYGWNFNYILYANPNTFEPLGEAKIKSENYPSYNFYVAKDDKNIFISSKRIQTYDFIDGQEVEVDLDEPSVQLQDDHLIDAKGNDCLIEPDFFIKYGVLKCNESVLK